MVMMSFSALVDHFVRAHEQGQLSHAYAIVGPAGAGKRLVAQAIIEKLHPTQTAQVANTVWVSPLEGDEKTKSKKDISIEQIREIKTMLAGGSLFAGHRVVVISPADAMNTAAANSLLKVLEEAPSHTTFVLLLENWQSIPETVLSRSQVFGLGLASAEEMDEVLARYSEDADERRRAAKASYGLIGKAHQILTDTEFAQEQFAHSNLFYELRGKSIYQQREHIEPLLGDKTDHVKQRRLLDSVFATWQCEAGLVIRERVAEGKPVGALAQLVNQLGKARHDITHNMHPKLVFENLMFSFYDAA